MLPNPPVCTDYTSLAVFSFSPTSLRIAWIYLSWLLLLMAQTNCITTVVEIMGVSHQFGPLKEM